jgi:hypothetical protein
MPDDIREYWVEEIANLLEFDLLADIENSELNKVKQAIDDLLNDQFIETATEYGIAKREAILDIIPYGDDTLETRRFRVVGKWMNRLPYTMRMLQERLDALLGAGCYEITLHKEPYTLQIKIELIAKRQFEAAQNMISEIAPANLKLIVELRYNQHIKLSNLTHGAMSSYTHAALREEAFN